MTHLDVRTAVSTVERALVDALSLGYQARHPAVANCNALKAVPSVGVGDVIPQGALRYVTSEGVCYRWRKFSTNLESLPEVVTPSDRATATRGRWERCTSTVTLGPAYFRPVHRVATGYAKSVQLWQGDEGTEAGLTRVFGQTPVFLVRWVGDDLRMKGPTPRSIHQVDMPFEIWCYSRNLRIEQEALEGSDIASEQQADPGLWQMMGDARYLLADCTLGLSPGVRYIDIQGSGDIIGEDLAQRRFVGVVPITVKASYNIPDEDLILIEQLAVQFQQHGGPDASIDPANYIVRGLGVPISSTLASTPDFGAAYVQGVLVSTQPGSHVFGADCDTYRFLARDGSLIYRAVAVNADAPATPSGTLLIGKTTTSDTAITFDAILANRIVNSGDPFEVPL